MSNNPPDFTLDLTSEEAEFLMRNCRANIHYGLQALQALDLDPNATEQGFIDIRDMLERFTALRDKLRAAGVPDAD